MNSKLDQATPEDVVEKNIVTLSTGIRLKCKPVAALLLNELTTKVKKPVPPRFMNTDLGREEENLSDPNYIRDTEAWEVKVSMMMINTMIMFGTSPVDISQSTDESWIEDLSIVGIDMPESPRSRYLSWVKFIAAPLPDDVNQIVEQVGRLSGVSERDVQTAVEKFRGDAE